MLVPRAAYGVLLAVVLAGCNRPENVIDSCSDDILLPPSVSTDILFVIDNSASMAEEQAKVVAELHTFVASLAGAPVKNDFQIGVITTGVSYQGRGCDPASNIARLDFPDQSGRLQSGKDLRGAVVDPSKPKIIGFDDPNLLPDFEVLIGQGTVGSGQEMGMEATRLAVSAPLTTTSSAADPPGNAGFLRPGSQLLIVIVSDEDDCSDPTATALALMPFCQGVCTTDAECGQTTGHYCILDGTGGRQCYENPCETPETADLLEPVARYAEAFQNLDDGLGRRREVYLAAIAAVDPDNPKIPQRCSRGGTEAYGVGTRYLALVDAMGDRGFVGSICQDSYATTLEQIAKLVTAPQALDLPESPPDGRLLQVEVTQVGGEVVRCVLDEDFDFEPAGKSPARIIMKNRCRLKHGDLVGVKLICAG